MTLYFPDQPNISLHGTESSELYLPSLFTYEL